jgi:cytoskeleton protein RodZ
MNPIQAVSPDEQNIVEFAESPGRRLRVQRQSKGWEIERVATQLHLRPNAVEALEQDRFDELPGPVFVMGYLRNYARLVGMDPDPLIGAYRASNPSSEPTTVPWVHAGGSPKPEIGSGHILVRLVSLGLLLAVIVLLVLWWQGRPEPLPEPGLGIDSPGLPLLPLEEPVGDEADLEEPGAVDSSLEAVEEGKEPEPPSPSPAAAGPGATLPLSATSNSESEPAEPPEPSAQPAEPGAASTADTTPEPTGAATEAQAGQPKVPEVVLSFTGTSWIDVRNAAGAVILTGEMHKGDRRVLSGDPPYSFVIGNSVAASVTVGDKPLDLSTKGRGGVARFKLDPSNPE